jgi:tetratricopeptide (TPR) repeat protein
MIGGVLQAQGDLAGALASYRGSLAIRKTLAAKEPGNTLWQRDLANSDEYISDVLLAQGDLAGALASYRDSLAIRKTLAAKEPGNTEWQRDLAKSLGSLSFILLFNRHPEEALNCAREALALDPSALWVETNRAHALLFLGRFDEAKAIYLANKDKKVQNQIFAAAVRNDFTQFRKSGINIPAMKDIEALLKE